MGLQRGRGVAAPGGVRERGPLLGSGEVLFPESPSLLAPASAFGCSTRGLGLPLWEEHRLPTRMVWERIRQTPGRILSNMILFVLTQV